MVRKTIRIGLTGSFGSGCSRLARALEQLGFESFSLSDFVKDEWTHRTTGKSIEDATREELQAIGNELRKTQGNEYLAKEAMKRSREKTEAETPLVFDSIRNTAEIEEFRREFRDFFLIAVDCSPPLRWERVKDDYRRRNLTEYDFERDDERDKYEEGIDYGQQVELCVDEADVLISNDVNYPDSKVAVDKLRVKIEDYVNLMSGEKIRTPTLMEYYMSMAYTTSLMSRCIKRRVGAVIVDEKNNVLLASGYNENPEPMEPCFSKYAGRCYRDIYKATYFRDMERKGQTCPKCGKKLTNLAYPFLCDCRFDLDKHFIRDRALNRCTALHGEEKAIMTVGSRTVQDCTLYTTTFPCFSCAQKIVYSRIKSVVYVEPYPDADSVDLLKETGISVRRFEGVKARAYVQLFGPWQREMEERMTRKKS